MSDFSDVIEDFNTGTYVVTRRTPVVAIKGRAQPPTTSMFSVRACVQPASGRQLQRLPDGMRKSETISIWCVEELITREVSNLPDLIEVGSHTYEIQNSRDYADLGNYFESLAIKVGDT